MLWWSGVSSVLFGVSLLACFFWELEVVSNAGKAPSTNIDI